MTMPNDAQSRLHELATAAHLAEGVYVGQRSMRPGSRERDATASQFSEELQRCRMLSDQLTEEGVLDAETGQLTQAARDAGLTPGRAFGNLR